MELGLRQSFAHIGEFIVGKGLRYGAMDPMEAS